MRTVGVIAEYNPFHTGHAYHLKKAREEARADFAVVVMSPDFVQRGEPALFDKYTRARMALLGGADLVLELPVCWATGSAEYFAEGAVALLDGLGVVDALCFGSENDDPRLFLQTAQLLSEEPAAYRAALQEQLRQGQTFPQARAAALAKCAPELQPGFLETPNNILGVEYCKALLRRHSSIMPLPVKRKGASYHSAALEGDCCSATAIRQTILRENNTGDGIPAASRVSDDTVRSCFPYIPAECRSLFQTACRTLLLPDDLMPFLIQKLLSDPDLESILDISPDLAARIRRLRYDCVGKTWRDTVALLSTKQVTEARIRRALLHLILDLRSDEIEYCRRDEVVYFARVLGFRQSASSLLRRIKRESSLPLITKPASAPALLNRAGLCQWEKTLFSSHLGRAALSSKYGQPFRTDYEISPVILR